MIMDVDKNDNKRYDWNLKIFWVFPFFTFSFTQNLNKFDAIYFWRIYIEEIEFNEKNV